MTHQSWTRAVSSAVVPFTHRGLTGGDANPPGGDDQTVCYPTRTVLVRFRIVFHSPAKLELNEQRGWLGAIARIDHAQIAVRTSKGKPIAYGEVFDSGKARLFTAPSTCF